MMLTPRLRALGVVAGAFGAPRAGVITGRRPYGVITGRKYGRNR